MASFKIKDVKSLISRFRKALNKGALGTLIFVLLVLVAFLAGVDPLEALNFFEDYINS